jgi:predicted ABC-type ATPase
MEPENPQLARIMSPQMFWQILQFLMAISYICKSILSFGKQECGLIKEIANDFVIETFNHLVDEAIALKKHFAYEGHFTEDSTWNIPRLFKNQGYAVHLIFFGLSDTNHSELRVLERVKDGGHYVPRLMIENNFYGNLDQLNRNFKLLDTLLIFDTSTTTPSLLAKMINTKLELYTIKDKLPTWFTKYLPEILK